MPLPDPPTVWDCCTRAGGIPETAARRSTFIAGRVDKADLPPIHHLQAGHVLLQPRATRTAHAGSLSDTRLAPAAAGYRLLRLNSSRWESNQAMTSLRFQRLCLPTL
jgi:hypothetical protein